MDLAVAMLDEKADLLGENPCGSVWHVDGRVEVYLPWDCECPGFCDNVVTLLQEHLPWLDSFYPDDLGATDLGTNISMVSFPVEQHPN